MQTIGLITAPTAWLSGTAAASGIALMNSIGNLAGFGGRYLIGWVGSTALGLLVLAVLSLLAACLVLVGKDDTTIEFGESVTAK